MKQPLCSILVAAYNAEKYIGRCLDSLLGQTLDGIEVIVIDDCSSDNTPQIVADYMKKTDAIVYIRLEKNCGQAHARNVGLTKVRGTYVGFLDSDDFFSADALESAVDVFERNPYTDCVLFRVVNCYEDGRMTDYPMKEFSVKTGFEAFKDSLTWKIHGVYMLRTSVHKRHPYDESCRYYSDDNTTRIHYYVSNEVRMCLGVYYYFQNPQSVTHAVSANRFDYLKANESMKRQLIGLKVDEEIITLYENVRWLVLVDSYMFYFNNRKCMSAELRNYALAEMKRVWRTIETRRLYPRNYYKLGYFPFRNFWKLFCCEEEIYFSLRKIMY